MPGNVLTGIVRITAPGVANTFNDISLRLKDQKAILKSLQTEYAKLSTSQLSSPLGKELAADIKIASTEIKRLEAATVPAFGNIGNAATKGFSALRQFAYVLPGIGIAGLIGGLSEMVIGLFESASAFDKAALSAEIFKDQLDQIKNASERLEGFLSLQNKIADLKFRIGGGEGNAADINNFKNQLASTGTIIQDATNNLNKFNDAEQKIVKSLQEASNVLGVAGKKNPLIELAQSGKDLTQITKAEADKLPKILKGLANEYIENREAIAGEDKRLTEAVGVQTVLRLQIKKEEVDEQKRLAKLSADELKKLREKEQQEALRQISEQNARIVAVFKERLKALENGIKLADEFKRKMDLALVAAGGTSGNKPGGVIGTGVGSGEGLAKAKKEFADYEAAFKSMVDNVNSSIDQLKVDALASVGEAIGAALTGGNLSNVFKSFADTLGSALQALGREFIKFGIIGQAAKTALKAFGSNPGLAVAAGIALVAAGSALKSALSKGVQARALGGPVNKGGAFLVGERGPELFVPNTGGNIVPNNRLGGVSGGGGMQFQVIGTNVIQGMDLLQIFTLAQQSQRRLQ